MYSTKSIILKLLAFSLILIGFTSCSDKPKEESKPTPVTVDNSIPKIEIVQNQNAQEIKVEEKQTKNKKNENYYFNYGIKSKYDLDSQPANKDASVRTKPRTAIEANMNVRSPYEKVQVSMLVKKLSKEFMVKCSACHNDYANGVIGPSLLNKTSDEIFNKIADFKSGKKSNVLMDDLIKMMSDKEIKALAIEIFEFNEKIKKMRKK